MYSILNFGKHKGKSLPEILLHDPDWFFWAMENHVLKKWGPAAQARDLDFTIARALSCPTQAGNPPSSFGRLAGELSAST
jgi:hypothetical protein